MDVDVTCLVYSTAAVAAAYTGDAVEYLFGDDNFMRKVGNAQCSL